MKVIRKAKKKKIGKIAINFYEAIEKYNKSHGKDGRFCRGGSAITVVPMGANAARIVNASAKLTVISGLTSAFFLTRGNTTDPVKASLSRRQ